MMGILGESNYVLRYKLFPKNWVFIRVSKNYHQKTVIAINNKKVPQVVNLPVRVITRFGFPFYEVTSVYRHHCGHKAEYLLFDKHDLLRCAICGAYR